MPQTLPALALAIVLAGCAAAPPEAGGRGGRGGEVRDVSRDGAGNAAGLLAGRYPGLRVVQTAGGLAVSFPRNARPDGEPVAPLVFVDGHRTPLGPGGEIPGLQAADVTAIEVKNRAVDLSIYGQDALGGIIEITTRLGRGDARD